MSTETEVEGRAGQVWGQWMGQGQGRRSRGGQCEDRVLEFSSGKMKES